MSKREIRRRVSALEERMMAPSVLTALGQAHWRLLRGGATDEDLRVILEDKVSDFWGTALRLAEERETDIDGRLSRRTDVKGTVAAIVATSPDQELDDALFGRLRDLCTGPEAPSFGDCLEMGAARLWLAFLTEQTTHDIREMFALRMHQYWVRRYSFESWLQKVQTRSKDSGSVPRGQKRPQPANAGRRGQPKATCKAFDLPVSRNGDVRF
ncbi:MAG: hypothetical protein ACRDKG_11550 [Actinomycetota bacterium]